MTTGADALNEKVGFFTAVALRQGHGRNQDVVEARSLIANVAFEMNMVMLVLSVGADFTAQGVARITGIVQYFVQQPFFDKRPKCPVDRNPVVITPQPRFHITMRQGYVGVSEHEQQLLPARCVAQPERFERISRSHG